MTAKKERTATQKTNNNNRKRGAAFEKNVAKALNWYRVPLSGSSSLFGWCDVRDSESKSGGYWLGECKTMTPDNLESPSYTIERKWLDKLVARSTEELKIPVLFMTLYGKPNKFVVMPTKLVHIIEKMMDSFMPVCFPLSIDRKTGQKNYKVSHDDTLCNHRVRAIRRVKMNTPVWPIKFDDETDYDWAIMHFDAFYKILGNIEYAGLLEEYYKNPLIYYS